MKPKYVFVTCLLLAGLVGVLAAASRETRSRAETTGPRVIVLYKTPAEGVRLEPQKWTALTNLDTSACRRIRVAVYPVKQPTGVVSVAVFDGELGVQLGQTIPNGSFVLEIPGTTVRVKGFGPGDKSHNGTIGIVVYGEL